MKLTNLYLKVFISNISFFLFLALISEKYKRLIFKEDGVIETLGAILFLFASILSLILYIKLKKTKKSYLYISIISFIAFLDELSFGQRIFDVKFPKINDVEIDAVHDFFYLFIKTLREFSFQTNFLIFLSIILFSSFILVKYRIIKLLNNHFTKQTLVLFSFFIFLTLSSLIIDLNILAPQLIYFEELFEMNAAILLIFITLSIRDNS